MFEIQAYNNWTVKKKINKIKIKIINNGKMKTSMFDIKDLITENVCYQSIKI